MVQRAAFQGWAVEGSGYAPSTLDKMKNLIVSGSRTREVIESARAVVRSVEPRDHWGQARAIRQWLASNVRFVRDPRSTELLQEPRYMLEQIYSNGFAFGDCDDAAILGGSLAKAIGFPVRLHALGFSGSPMPYQHVYADIVVTLDVAGDEMVVDLDTTREHQHLPPRVASRRLLVRVP